MERGEPAGARARNAEAARDLGRRHQSLAYLAAAGALLASSLDYATTLERVAQLALPDLADWCAVDLVGADGELETVALAHAVPENAALLRELRQRYPPRPDAPHGVRQVLRTREPVLLPEVRPQDRAEIVASDDECRLLLKAGYRSLMRVPLLVRERVLGVISFGSGRPDRLFDEEDLLFAEELARYAALAIDNSRLHAQVAESRERLHFLLSSTSAVFYSYPHEGGETGFVSENVEALLGYPADRFATEAGFWRSLVHPEDLPRLDGGGSEFTDGRRTVEYRLRDSGGSYKWIRDEARLVPGPRGAATEVVGFWMDVTDQRRARRRDSVFRSLGQRLNSASTPEDAGRIAVEAADELIGWDACWVELWNPDEEVSYPVLLIDTVDGERKEFAPASSDRERCARARGVVERGAQLILRDPDPGAKPRVYFGDATRRSESLMYVPIRSGEQVVGLLSIQSYEQQAYSPSDLETLKALADYCVGALERTFADARRQRLEARLREAQKLEAVGRLAGGIAHDFNNMLAVILGYTELLLARTAQGETDQDALLEIKQAAERSAELTRQLLAVGRKQLLEPRWLDLNQEIVSAAPMLGRLLHPGTELALELAPEPCHVRMDPGELAGVLLNLTLNSRDAMPEGGRLVLRTRHGEWLDTDGPRAPDLQPGPVAILEIVDTGVGMEAEVRERIFEPFYTTKVLGHGTGLGLAIVYGVVNQSGGHVEVESALGTGTCFRVYLPLAETAAPAEPPENPLAASEPGVSLVLLVEDEALVRRLTRRLLQHAGCSVWEAASGEEALRLVDGRVHELELLVTDVVMPGMSGLTLAHQLRMRSPSLPVLFMTGHSESREWREVGLDARTRLLTKPFSASEFNSLVKELLACSRHIPA